tara:strand:- start:180 stop:395 length:216 start_codon:yes stop_codon:yes gene_type:complete
VSDDNDIIDRYEKLTNDIDEVYQRSEQAISSYIYDDDRDTFIDPWSEMKELLGLDVLQQVAKVNRQVQNDE